MSIECNDSCKKILAFAYLHSRERLREIAALIGQDKGQAARELAEQLLRNSDAEQWARQQIGEEVQ